jgi:hypothetical protein
MFAIGLLNGYFSTLSAALNIGDVQKAKLGCRIQ